MTGRAVVVVGKVKAGVVLELGVMLEVGGMMGAVGMKVTVVLWGGWVVAVVFAGVPAV